VQETSIRWPLLPLSAKRVIPGWYPTGKLGHLIARPPDRLAMVPRPFRYELSQIRNVPAIAYDGR
jgi:hypothetical protein